MCLLESIYMYKTANSRLSFCSWHTSLSRLVDIGGCFRKQFSLGTHSSTRAIQRKAVDQAGWLTQRIRHSP
jgi:hypothetical protein